MLGGQVRGPPRRREPVLRVRPGRRQRAVPRRDERRVHRVRRQPAVQGGGQGGGRHPRGGQGGGPGGARGPQEGQGGQGGGGAGGQGGGGPACRAEGDEARGLLLGGPLDTP